MRTRTIALVAGTGLALALTTTTGAASARGHHTPDKPDKPGSPGAPAWTEVANGLDSPRLLSFDGKSLYVTEAGRGGPGPCVDGPEGNACLGATGAVTRVTFTSKHRTHGHHQHGRHGKRHLSKHQRHQPSTSQRRVLTGLPSLAGPDGSQGAGPTDIQVDGDRYMLSVNLGNVPSARDAFGAPGALLGTVVTGKFRWHTTTAAPRLYADLAAFEAANDPDSAGPDSNPTGFTTTRHGLTITDAGGNTLLRVRRGEVSVLATFAERMVPAPPFMPPGDIPMQAVPTSVAVGPDKAYYVSQLTGFPFPPGAATIWRVVPGQSPTAYATGLTNVTDLAWHRGKLYAVQLTDGGLLNVPEGSLPTGSLTQVNRNGTHTTVAEGLPAPYGVALQDKAAYVTTCSVCPGGGAVVKVPLR